MQIRRILVTLMGGFLIVSLTACNMPTATETAPIGTSPVGQIPPAATGGTCANALYPVVQGATWTYTVNGGPNGSFTYTDTITEVRADGFTVTSQFSDVSRTQEWKCTPDGLLALSVDGGNAAGLSTQGLKADFTTSGATGITLPSTVPSGMKWNYGLDIQGTIEYQNQSADANGSVLTDMQEAGTESVTVPAGTFDAMKIEGTSTFNITATFHGLNIPVTVNGNTTLWYAPGVGLVKSTESSNIAGQSLSSTTELQSFNIP